MRRQQRGIEIQQIYVALQKKGLQMEVVPTSNPLEIALVVAWR